MEQEKCNQIKEILLNAEQLNIINADIDKNLKIIACAGSGKTTTAIWRVKFLIDNGANPNKIVITAFNIDAAKQIKTKLVQIMSHTIESQIKVNNIDKLARQYLLEINPGYQEKYLHVKEFMSELVKLLQKSQECLMKFRQKIDYFFFDEFQDINSIEYEFLKLLVSVGIKVTVIGDDAQNIYSFRDSTLEPFQTLIDNDFPNLQTFSLSVNYRSSPELVSFANQIVLNSNKLTKKQMISSQSQSKEYKPEVMKFNSFSHQNQILIQEIEDHIKQGVKPCQIAILCRSNNPLQYLEEALEQHNRNINQSQKKETEKDNLNSTQKQAQDRQVIQYQCTTSNQENQNFKSKHYKANPDQNQIILSTIHKAKGLEWNIVYLIGCNDEFFPGTYDTQRVEEERRIFYVAVTRAKNKLFICFLDQNNQNKKITRFISEIPKDLYIGYCDLSPNLPVLSEISSSATSSAIKEHCMHQQQIEDELLQQKRRNDYFLHKINTNLLVKLIQQMDNQNYTKIRELKIIDDITQNVMNIHLPTQLNPYLYQNNIMVNFANFLDRYITRLIGETFKINEAYQDNTCSQVIFSSNESNLEEVKELLKLSSPEKGQQFKTPNKKGVLENEQTNQCSDTEQYALELIKQNDQYEKFIPDPDQRKMMIKSYVNYQDQDKSTDKILQDIYNVSLCGEISNQRRRILYLKEAYENFRMHFSILKQIQKGFIPYLNSIKQLDSLITCKKVVFEDNYNLKAQIDLIIGDVMVEYKFSSFKDVPIEWIIQFLAKLSLFNIITQNNNQQYKINKVALYNVLQGKLCLFDVSNWQKDKDLLDYLTQVRELNTQKQIQSGVNAGHDFLFEQQKISQQNKQIQQDQEGFKQVKIQKQCFPSPKFIKFSQKVKFETNCTNKKVCDMNNTKSIEYTQQRINISKQKNQI